MFYLFIVSLRLRCNLTIPTNNCTYTRTLFQKKHIAGVVPMHFVNKNRLIFYSMKSHMYWYYRSKIHWTMWYMIFCQCSFHIVGFQFYLDNIDGLVHDCNYSIAHAIELLQSSTKISIYNWNWLSYVQLANNDSIRTLSTIKEMMLMILWTLILHITMNKNDFT